MKLVTYDSTVRAFEMVRQWLLSLSVAVIILTLVTLMFAVSNTITQCSLSARIAVLEKELEAMREVAKE